MRKIIPILLAGICLNSETFNINFINGVWNSLEDARKGKDKIFSTYSQLLPTIFPQHTFKYTLLYNKTNGKLDDLREVMLQKALERKVSLTDNEIANYIVMLRMGEIDNTDSRFLIAQEAYNEYYNSNGYKNFFEGLLLASSNQITSDLNQTDISITSGIVSQIRVDEKVILLPHSQGNLFANSNIELIRTAIPSKRYDTMIAGVATPASRVVDLELDRYLTANDDNVINTIRTTSGALSGNVDNGIVSKPLEMERDIANHSFIESYFQDGLKSKELIDSYLLGYISRFNTSTIFDKLTNLGITGVALNVFEYTDFNMTTPILTTVTNEYGKYSFDTSIVDNGTFKISASKLGYMDRYFDGISFVLTNDYLDDNFPMYRIGDWDLVVSLFPSNNMTSFDITILDENNTEVDTQTNELSISSIPNGNYIICVKDNTVTEDGFSNPSYLKVNLLNKQSNYKTPIPQTTDALYWKVGTIIDGNLTVCDREECFGVDSGVCAR